LLPAEISAELEASFALTVQNSRSLGGGCIHHAQRLECAEGSYFIKYNQLSQLHNFEVEAKGLQLLGRGGILKVPEVIGTGKTEAYAFLVLELIESGSKASDYWEQLGEGLAQLHQQTQAQFGLAYDNYIGSLVQTNRYRKHWPDFFRDERLEPMLQMATKKGLIDKTTRQRFDRLYQKLDQFFPQEPPALLHGDLWGGNLMTGSTGEPVLIDPAVYYGHREMELAFMTLFDSQPPAFYQAYQSVYPLSEGYRERFDLCNLYPLLVHVNLFGIGYLGSVQRILGRYV
jgi:protein-ribulosamine 3-kinase